MNLFTCLLLFAALRNAKGFLDSHPVKRIKEYTDLSKEMTNSNKVISLIIHRGECEDSKGCSELESVLATFAEDNEGLSDFLVLECQDVLQSTEDGKKIDIAATVLTECLEDSKALLPMIMFFQPPAKKKNDQNGHYYGIFPNKPLQVM